MGSNNEACTDAEFIKIWGHHRSAVKVAETIGVCLRAVYLRRRFIEQHYKIKLSATDPRGLKYDIDKPKSFSPLKQIDLGILDGCVIVCWRSNPVLTSRKNYCRNCYIYRCRNCGRSCFSWSKSNNCFNGCISCSC